MGECSVREELWEVDPGIVPVATGTSAVSVKLELQVELRGQS